MLDEPAGGLSHEEVAAFGDFLLDIRERLDLTVLLVEHHMGLVMRVSRPSTCSISARRSPVAAPTTCANDPAVIEAYLGTTEEDEE